MTMSKDEFEVYIKKHKIAQKSIIEAYIAENPKDEYHYDDIGAVYLCQVDAQIRAHTIGRARQGRVECGHGAARTMNGTKYGRSYYQ